MKKMIALLGGLALSYGCGSTQVLVTEEDKPVQAQIDLVNVVDDRVGVVVDPGPFPPGSVTFFIPETVPGTYSIDNYGQYVEALKAFDYSGAEIPVTRDGMNAWVIADGKALDKVTYLVNDTYDTETDKKDAVFSPAGTNIVADETFMLNLHGFVGYFEGYKEQPYELEILAPERLTASTSLPRKVLTENAAGRDVFVARRYFEVIDNPVLYASSTEESFQISDITVNLRVYSPNGAYDAADLRGRMQEMMQAQKAFLGDIDGTREYSILLHLSSMAPDEAQGFGALEHHTSTVVVLPEQMPRANLEQAMVDVVSHEFFHIVTPLNVHSKEIHYFDYNNPKMSKHLWMYEGTTEYFANLFQINQGLIDEADFYGRLMDKMQGSKAYADEMSFTTMSRNILEDPYKENYANVYEKGALINMALDIRLRELSHGEKGVLWLMKKLSDTYDVNTPFEDDALIDEIVALTYPEIRDFFDTHVTGNTPIDYREYLAKVGLTTAQSREESGYFLNGEVPYIDVDPSEDNAIFIREGIELNSFLKDLGAQGGDVIKKIDDTAINLDAIRPIIGQSFAWDPQREITMVVLRGEEEVLLEGTVGKPTVAVERILPLETVSEAQAALRQAWLKG